MVADEAVAMMGRVGSPAQPAGTFLVLVTGFAGEWDPTPKGGAGLHPPPPPVFPPHKPQNEVTGQDEGWTKPWPHANGGDGTFFLRFLKMLKIQWRNQK